VRGAEETDLPQIRDISNFFIQNTVITFDDVPHDLAHWQEKFEYLSKLEFPFLVMTQGLEILGFAYVTPWRQRTGHLKIVEDQIYLAPAATGKKLGSRLLEELLNGCRKIGIK
jgi:phosphinothricin acetyltransferase